MEKIRLLGSTSNIERFMLINSGTGDGLTGLDHTSVGLIISTIADNESSATTYTVAAGNVETIATLGTYAAPTAGKCRFKEVDATNHPGLYEFQFADARYNVSSSKGLSVSVSGAANLRDAKFEIELNAANVVWDEVLTGSTHNITNSAGRRIRSLQEAGGYSGGAVWIDTINGTAGTTSFENGVEVNPVDSLADAITIAAAVGLFKFEVAGGSTITLTQAFDNYVMLGHGWNLNLNGQSVSGTHFAEAVVSGTCTGATPPHFHHCEMGSCTIPPSHVHDGLITGTITAGSAGTFEFQNNIMNGSIVFDFGAAVGNTTFNFGNNFGDFEIQNMGQSGTDVATIVGGGHITINANCVGGTINLFGSFTYTNNGSGITINENANTSFVSGICTEARLSELDAGTAGKMANQVDEIRTDTENIQGRVPAALTGDGNMKSDALAISGSTDAADNLEASAETMLTGVAQAGTLSTTQMTTDVSEATNDHFNGRIIIWTSGVLLRQATAIEDYEGTNGLFTFTATTEPPSAGDTFIII